MTSAAPRTTRRKKADHPAHPTPRQKTSERIFNLEPSKGTENDWRFGDAVDAGLLTVTARPASVDLRRAWWKVGDQRNTGSCVGWAAADGVGRYVMVKAGKLAESKRLSPRHLWMSSKETDQFDDRPTSFVEGSGTSLKTAMDVARKYGFALESDLPFEISTTMFVGAESAFYAGIAQRRISYVNLGLNLTQWKDWLAQNGPILAGLAVDENWMQVGADGALDAFDSTTIRGGHAVCIVGYRTDGTFIIRNSWGTGWGDQGFAYATPAYLQAAFYQESYGALAT